jgi:hypothetical protein
MFGDDRPEVGLSDGATLSEEPPSEAPSAEVVTPLPSPSPEASETPSPPPSAEVHEATPPPPVATEPAPTTAPPSPPPSPSPRRHYFNVDHNYNGRTVTLAVGEELMFLFGRYYGPEYTPLVVSDPEVLTTDGEPRHTPDTQRGGDGDHGYLYVAVKPGEVTVSSRVDDSCSYESPPCESPTSEWYVNVIVTG